MTDAPAWRFAICNELFEGWSLDKAATFAAATGYQGLELAPFTLVEAPRLPTDLSAAERAAIRRTVESAGLSVVGLHWLLAKTEGLQLNHPDAVVRERTVGYLLALIDLCADLGGELLVFGSPQQRSLHPAWPRAQAWDSTVAAMRRCGERAAERGLVFCIEPLARNETDFITTVDEAVDLVRAVAHPGLRLIVDVKAMAQDGRAIPDQIRLAASWLRHVHVNDPNRLGPGMGDVDFAPILATLQEIGYAGWLSVEVFDFTPGPEVIARASLATLTATG